MRIFIDEIKRLFIDSGGAIPIDENGGGYTLEIKSSIYEMFPKVAITNLKIGEYTPDALGYFLGDSMEIKYQLVDNDDSSKASISEFIPKMLINDFKARASSAGMMCDIFLCNELAFYQKMGIQGAYNNSLEEVLMSMRASNGQWSEYGADFAKSDTTNTVFRTLSQTESTFIENQLYPNFLIENDRPLFWVGLDKYLHCSSFSKMVANSDQCDAIINLGKGYTGITNDAFEEVKKTVVKKGAVDINSISYDIEIGDPEFYKQLAPQVSYYNNTVPFADEVKSIEATPTGTSGKYLPINKLLSMLATGSDSCPTLTFRPDTHIQQEAKNLILKNAKPFIKIHAKGCTFAYGNAPEETKDSEGNIESAGTQREATGDEKLLLAGQTAYVTFPYFYSVYNGPYVIEEIYYNAQATGIVVADITLASNTLDMKCYDMLDSHKENSRFEYDYAPVIHKASLIKSK